MVKIVAFDGGHEIEKWKTSTLEGSFRHAMREISQTEYEQIKRRSNGKPPQDFIRINDGYFVIGDAAERYGQVTKAVGAARYRSDYIGRLFASALARAYQSGGEVEVVASHPTRDINYRDDLLEALLGTWHVECEGRERVYEVIEANAFDEPQGGLMNLILTEDGTAYQNQAISEGRTLVLDVGGGTTGMIAAEPGGWVDYSFRADTIQLGIMDVLIDFEIALRDRHADALKSATTLRPERLREALVTGTLVGGGEELPCEEEARQAKSRLLNQIAQRYQQRAGGPRNWDAIVLTGGGAGLLFDDLVAILDHKQIFPADDLHGIHYANVRGLRKLRNFYKALERQEHEHNG